MPIPPPPKPGESYEYRAIGIALPNFQKGKRQIAWENTTTCHTDHPDILSYDNHQRFECEVRYVYTGTNPKDLFEKTGPVLFNPKKLKPLDFQNKPLTPLQALDQWNRKYYSFSLEANGNMQVGDGPFIVLSGGGRKVTVSDYDLSEYENGRYPTLDDLVTEALRLWHADTTEKRYRVLYEINKEILLEIKDHWLWHGNRYMCNIIATSEDEAKAKVIKALQEKEVTCKVISLWETTKD